MGRERGPYGLTILYSHVIRIKSNEESGYHGLATLCIFVREINFDNLHVFVLITKSCNIQQEILLQNDSWVLLSQIIDQLGR